MIAPAGFLLYYFWIRDRWEKEPWGIIWFLFGLGCLSVLPAGVIEIATLGIEMELETVGQVYFASFIAIGLVEEGIKLACVYLFTARTRHFTEEIDGIIYAVAVGLGFAFLENIVYVVGALLEGPNALAMAVLRAFTAVPSHALDGVMLGYFLGLSKFMPQKTDRLKALATGLILATLFHGLYDSFALLLTVLPESRAGWCIVGIVWTLIVQWGVAHRLLRSAQELATTRWRGTKAPIHKPKTLRFCRHCQAVIPAEAVFCPQCGAPLPRNRSFGL